MNETKPFIIFRKDDGAPFLLQPNGKYVLKMGTWIGDYSLDEGFHHEYELKHLSNKRFFVHTVQELLETYKK